MPEEPLPFARRAAWRNRLYVIIFGHTTPAGRAFDVALILLIALSVLAVMLESLQDFRAQYGSLLRQVEWVFTVLFTIEYLLRMVSAVRPGRYAVSFYGIVDVLAVIPTYISVLIPGAQYFLIIRVLRVLRVFRVLKLAPYLSEADVLLKAMRASRRKITVFLFTVITLVVVLGSMMYVVEGPESGFTSIPRAIYWAIVTLTTVGYGDITPVTGLGQFLASVVMVMGYGIIAVPTGIVTVELANAARGEEDARRATGTAGAVAPAAAEPLLACTSCGLRRHDPDAIYCKRCGHPLKV